MFNKKKCSRCGEKIKDSYDFCPFCGNSFQTSEDFGMLGRNDFTPVMNEIKLPMGLDMILNSLTKSLDKEFREMDKSMAKEMEQKKQMKEKNVQGISISISSMNGQAPKIQVSTSGNFQEKKQIKPIKIQNEISDENMKLLSTLPRKEPKTNIRRLSNKVIYEIELPGVKSPKDIIIVPLENSIEIKAVSKDKIYFKLLPINLPIASHNFSDEKLTLELQGD